MFKSGTIAPEFPYSSLYNAAYVYIDPTNGRRVVDFKNTQTGKRFKTNYARYLMSVKMGRFVPEELEVDHINDNFTDDRIENLQLLTGLENLQKQRSNLQVYFALIICPNCSIVFSRPIGHFHTATLAQNLQFCSHWCYGKFKRYALGSEAVEWIYSRQCSMIIMEHKNQLHLHWKNPMWNWGYSDPISVPTGVDFSPMSKVTESSREKAAVIKELYAQGLSDYKIGQRLGLGQSQVWRLRNRL